MLVGFRRIDIREIHYRARMQHCAGQCVLLTPIQTPNKYRHHQRGNLIIGPTAVANTIYKRGYLLVRKCFIVAFGSDYFLRTHKLSKFRTDWRDFKRMRLRTAPAYTGGSDLLINTTASALIARRSPIASTNS